MSCRGSLETETRTLYFPRREFILNKCIDTKITQMLIQDFPTLRNSVVWLIKKNCVQRWIEIIYQGYGRLLGHRN